jgi:hypothetical protein
MTDYTNIHDPFAYPYEYKAEDLDPDIRDADTLTWREKRIAQTIRDRFMLEQGCALARAVLKFHDHYAILTEQMSVVEHMRFDWYLSQADHALVEMAAALADDDDDEDDDHKDTAAA